MARLKKKTRILLTRAKGSRVLSPGSRKLVATSIRQQRKMLGAKRYRRHAIATERDIRRG